jgi:hypothetical protein
MPAAQAASASSAGGATPIKTKKWWLAVALNLFPLAMGLGYIYLGLPGRFIIVFGIQLLSLLPMTLLGLREYNAYLLLGLWAVSLIDVHSQASKINHRAPSAKETLLSVLVVVLAFCVCAGLGGAVYWLWNEGDQLLNLTAAA